MSKFKKGLCGLLAAAFTLIASSNYASVDAAAKKTTTVPKIKFSTQPQTLYNAGDIVYFKLHAPEYSGKVQYRVVLWHDETKSYKDLWTTGDRYYKNWQPIGKEIFNLHWGINEPGHYRITIYAKRAGISNNKTALKGMNCDSYVAGIPFVVKAKETDTTNPNTSGDVNNLFDAVSKANNLQSMESTSNINIKFNAQNLSEDEKEAFGDILEMFGNINLSVKTKSDIASNGVDQQHQIDIGATASDMALDTSIWLDMKSKDNKTSVKEIVKIPEIISSFLPEEYANKQYLVIEDEGANAVNKNLVNIGQKLNIKISDAFKSYLKETNSKALKFKGIDSVTVQNNKTSALMFEIKLNDAEFKSLLKDIVNKLAKDKEFVNLLEEYMTISSETLEGVQTEDSSQVEIQNTIKELKNNTDEFLTGFNQFMDKVKDIKIVGDKGITLNYGVTLGGDLISQSGTIDLQLDMAKLQSLAPATDEEGTNEPLTKALLKFTISFDTKMFNINKDININVPTVDQNNSITQDELAQLLSYDEEMLEDYETLAE